MLIEEYKRSLKMPEAEEFLDLIFYRPLAFVFVKAIYRLPITPNQVTVLSMISGFVAAWYFSLGTSSSVMAGAIWYAVANVLDCSDGQLARLQQSGTFLGRVIDGVADYFSSTAIFIGLGLGLALSGHSLWWLVVLSGASSALHAVMFDRYQSEFISTVRTDAAKPGPGQEVEQFTRELHRMREEGGRGVRIVFLKLHLHYLALQQPSAIGTARRELQPGSYRKKNHLMIRLWSVLGPTTNRTLLVICALAGRIDLFLWIIATLGNAWLIVCYVLQHRIHRQLGLARV
jgi:phosphatidylglycerophosphate synthase